MAVYFSETKFIPLLPLLCECQNAKLIDLMQTWRLQRNEPHHEKEHIKINTTQFHSYMWNGTYLKNPKIRDKCMAVQYGWTDYHIFVSYFRVVLWLGHTCIRKMDLEFLW